MADADQDNPSDREPARLTDRHGGQEYLLPWGGRFYHVPRKAVISYAKSHNKICSAQELGKLLVCMDEYEWYSYLRPDFLMHIKGIEGSQVFTTFQLENHPNERRILRVVPHAMCVRNFPTLREHRSSPENAELNRRQRARAAVLHWRPVADLPGRENGFVLSPISNAWTEVAYPDGSAAIWPGPNLLLKAADPILPQIYDIGALDSDEDGDGVSFSESYDGTRPTKGRLQHVPFAPPPAREPERMRAAHERVRLAYEKMQCIRQDAHEYVSRLLEQNAQAHRAPNQDGAQASNLSPAVVRSTKDAVRDATDELFDLKEQLSEGSYVEITKSLKRSWDCAV